MRSVMRQMQRPVLACALVVFVQVCSGNTDSHFHPEEIEKVEQSIAGASNATKRTGEDWAGFLGPRGTGISGETGLLKKWPETGPSIVWKRRIGEGYSAPSVRGNRLVLF